MNLKKISDNKSLRSQIRTFLDSAIVDADFPFKYGSKDCVLKVRPDSSVTIALYIDEDRRFYLHDEIESLDLDEVTEYILQTLKKRVSDSIEIPKIKNSKDLKAFAESLGIDTTKKSVAQIESDLAKVIWDEEHPGEEMPDQVAPMLIHDLTAEGAEHISKNYKSDEWYAQRKLNGMRFILVINPDGSTRMTSRAKSVKNFRYSELDEHVLGLQNIKSPFSGKVILDGEIKHPKAEIDLPSGVHTTSTLQSTVALMHMNSEESLKLQETVGSLIYHVFDILMLDGESTEQLPYEQRAELVETTVQTLLDENPGAALESVPVVKDYEDAWKLFEEYTGRGEEGIILKHRKAPYEQGKRTKNQFKVKAFVTIDAFITDFVPASKDRGNANLIGGFVFSTNLDGKETRVAAVSNIDNATRKAATIIDDNGNPTLNPEWVGKCAELIGQDFNSKSLQLNSARINEWRPDKNPEDCQLLREQMRFNTSVE